MDIKVYATLREVVGGKSVHLDDVAEMTVDQMLQKLLAKYPDLRMKMLNRNGELHSAFQILINGRDARYLNGMETVITAADEVRIFPPVGGGV
jgi:molybdopterin synthase sulfur carrier subunit